VTDTSSSRFDLEDGMRSRTSTEEIHFPTKRDDNGALSRVSFTDSLYIM